MVFVAIVSAVLAMTFGVILFVFDGVTRGDVLTTVFVVSLAVFVVAFVSAASRHVRRLVDDRHADS